MSRRCGVQTAKGAKGLGAREPLLGGGRGEPCGEIPRVRIRSVRVCVCGARCAGLDVQDSMCSLPIGSMRLFERK